MTAIVLLAALHGFILGELWEEMTKRDDGRS
jgi:hypothetical protein